MIVRILACLFLVIPVSVMAQDAVPSIKNVPARKEVPKLETVTEKASYAIGFNIGNDLKRQGLELTPDLLFAGIAASLANEESILTDEEIQATFDALRAEMRKKMAEKAAKNLEAGNAFLEANKKKDGVEVTESGLQYLVLKEGDGEMPTPESIVTVHYKGTNIDGTTFDSSYEGKAPLASEAPTTMPLARFIPGWQEALQLMKVGAKHRLFVPSALAYEEAGYPPKIEPNSVLIFELELIGVSDGAEEPGDKN